MGKLDNIKRRIKDLEKIRDTLSVLLEHCAASDESSTSCPIWEKI